MACADGIIRDDRYARLRMRQRHQTEVLMNLSPEDKKRYDEAYKLFKAFAVSAKGKELIEDAAFRLGCPSTEGNAEADVFSSLLVQSGFLSVLMRKDIG